MEPEIVAPGVISTLLNEFGGAVSPDGRELYFSVSVQHSYRYAIWVSRRRADGRWGAPELAPFSGQGRDFDPIFSLDGRRLLFISDRPHSAGAVKRDYDIWYVDRQTDGRWSAPAAYGPPVNSVADAAGDGGVEEFASIAADGTLYFAGDRPGGGMAIFVSRRIGGTYQPREMLPEAINAGTFVGEPVIAPDQSFMLFSGFGLSHGFGGWDIYVARRNADGSWGTPENLGPRVNTAERDYSPRLAPDGYHLYFTSERFSPALAGRLDWGTIQRGLAGLMNGQGNIYRVDLRTLGLRAFPPAR